MMSQRQATNQEKITLRYVASATTVHLFLSLPYGAPRIRTGLVIVYCLPIGSKCLVSQSTARIAPKRRYYERKMNYVVSCLPK